MRTRKFMRLTISVLRIAAVAWCLSLSVFAQTPSPTPSPVPAGSAGSSLPQFFDNLIGRAGAVLVASRARYHLRFCEAVA
jgi:hypothetical protein